MERREGKAVELGVELRELGRVADRYNHHAAERGEDGNKEVSLWQESAPRAPHQARPPPLGFLKIYGSRIRYDRCDSHMGDDRCDRNMLGHVAHGQGFNHYAAEGGVIIEMSRWIGLAPWKFEFPFTGSFKSEFGACVCRVILSNGISCGMASHLLDAPSALRELGRVTHHYNHHAAEGGVWVGNSVGNSNVLRCSDVW